MNSDRPHVELLWWEGCPSWQRAYEMLSKAMDYAGLDPQSITTVRIDTDEQAERERFAGSPTIRIDGHDIAPPPDLEPHRLACRIYHLRDGRVSPLPDPLDLREALKQAVAGKDGI